MELEYSDWHKLFTSETAPKYQLYDIISAKIFSAIDQNLSECMLFDMKHEPYVCLIDHSEFSEILEHCLEYFVKQEDYDICCVIRDAIIQHVKK